MLTDHDHLKGRGVAARRGPLRTVLVVLAASGLCFGAGQAMLAHSHAAVDTMCPVDVCGAD